MTALRLLVYRVAYFAANVPPEGRAFMAYELARCVG